MNPCLTTPLCAASLTVLIGYSAAHGALIKVDQSGGGDALTVQAGMLLASPGDTVAVRHGLHFVTNVELVNGVQLLGGWNDTFTSRIPGSSHLQGGGNHILKCTSGQGLSTLIDGFEISGANVSAVECDASSATISNNEFHGNSGPDGPGVHCQYGASSLIENNHFHHNSANYGGAIRGHWGSDTSPTIRNNLIEYNSGGAAGGGIGVNNGSAIIEDNVIQFNSTNGTGGGIHVWHAEGGTVEIRRNLVIYNSAPEGGGIGITGGHPIIENNTIWGNAAPLGGCVYQEESVLPDPGTTQVRNNILAGATQGNAAYCVSDLSMALSCNVLYGNAGGTYFGCPPGVTDLLTDPKLCDPVVGNFLISSDSPCAPPGATGCGLIGAFGVGCGPVSLEAMSWGEIKALYR